MSDIIRMSGVASGMDTESLITALVSSKKTNVDTAKKAQKRLEWTQDAWKGLNTKICNLYNKSLSPLRFTDAFNKKKTTTNNAALSVVASSNSVDGVQTARVTSMAKAGYLTGADLKEKHSKEVKMDTKLTELGITEGSTIRIATTNNSVSKDITITADMTMEDLNKELKLEGINANYDVASQRLFISSAQTGLRNDFTLTGLDTGGTAALDALGLTTSEGATKIAASDATLVLNGATFTSETNSFDINNSTYTVNALCQNEDITITTATDAQGIYDMIRDFFTEYNSVVNEMSKLYNASPAKGYEPLLDEEKDAMSDSQVEDWEKKIKDGILSKNDTLYGVLDAMRNTMVDGVEINGKKIYLSEFGIETQNYFEATDETRNAYHIDGDSKDAISADKTDKLLSKITTDPESVTTFFTELSRKLYSALTDKMGSTDYSSIYKVYNDKKMASDYADYTIKIAELEEKLSAYEDKYYKKFAAMESAMAKLNSNESALSSLFTSN